MKESDNEDVKQITETIKSRKTVKPHFSWIPIIILLIIIAILILISIHLPKVIIIILIRIPIASSIFNLFMFEREINNFRFGAKR